MLKVVRTVGSILHCTPVELFMRQTVQSLP